MSLPDRFNFSFPSSGETWEKGGNRLVTELERMYELLAFNLGGASGIREWKPTLVGGTPVKYGIRQGKHLSSLHYSELFFEVEYKARKGGSPVAFLLPLERGNYIMSLPTSGLIRGKVDNAPFMGSGMVDKEGKAMEIWNISPRTPTPLIGGEEVYMQGTVKILRER